MEKNFKEKLQTVDTFVFDVDGVFTDGSVMLLENGEMVRRMNIKDGYALQLAVKKGYNIAIITGGRSEAVRGRFEGLGVSNVYLGSSNKLDVYEEFLYTYDIKEENILYMGDDIPDYQVMQRVGVPTCPMDAAPEIKELCLYISQVKGGHGCVRDVMEQVMRLQGKWMDSLDSHEW